ncbi:MAG TPA: hypothetical protein ENI61_05295, partial [Ignavibacteria bacterium]|nr:hypothetical protein [Ignavibacteria bacterium]
MLTLKIDEFQKVTKKAFYQLHQDCKISLLGNISKCKEAALQVIIERYKKEFKMPVTGVHI